MNASFIALWVLCFPAFAGTLVFNGKAYSLSEKPKENCGQAGGPTYFAKLAMLDFAQKNGEVTARALCKGRPEFCDPKTQARFALDQVFAFIRNHPRRQSSPACKALRNECGKRCDASGLLEREECFLECNQYENYNRD